MTDLVEFVVPRLARSSHDPDSGVGCVMNLMCWVKNVPNQEDMPPGVFEPFRDALVMLNDNMCIHLTNGFDNHNTRVELNCPDCSTFLIDSAFTFSESSWINEADEDDYGSYTNAWHEPLTKVESRMLDLRVKRVNDTAQELRVLIPEAVFTKEDIAQRRAKMLEQNHGIVSLEIFDMNTQGPPPGERARYESKLGKLKRQMNDLIDFYRKMEDKYHPIPEFVPPAKLLPAALQKANFNPCMFTKNTLHQ